MVLLVFFDLSLTNQVVALFVLPDIILNKFQLKPIVNLELIVVLSRLAFRGFGYLNWLEIYLKTFSSGGAGRY